MSRFIPLRIRIDEDPDRLGRFRWSVSDEYAGLFKSPGDFATEREALDDAEKYVDRRIRIWQKRKPTLIKTPKRPRDLNQWAKRVVDLSTGEMTDREPSPEEQGKDPAAR